MSKCFVPLRGAHDPAYAACYRFALDALYVRAANRAATRKVNKARLFESLFYDYLDDLWDHIARAANDYRVADADVFAPLEVIDFVHYPIDLIG